MEEIQTALFYDGSPTSPIGGIFNSIEAENAASYFSGYLAMKLDTFHNNKLGSKAIHCETCSSIFVTQDLNLHLFISFKEYKENVDSS